MSLILFLVFGFVIGLLARALVPGRQSAGIIVTTLLGVAGSFIGGLVGNALVGEPLMRLHPAGFIGSLLGAVALLLAYLAVTRRTGTTYDRRVFR